MPVSKFTTTLFLILCVNPVWAQKLVSTILPVQLIVKEIAGDDLDNAVLMSPGSSPHYYALSMSDRQRLAEADLVFWMGPDLEATLRRVLASNDKSVPLVAGETLGHARESPHAWLDPIAVRTMAVRIADALKGRFPQFSRQFTDNLKEFERRLRVLDEDSRAQLGSLRDLNLVYHHDSFTSLARQYGLPEGIVLLPGHARQASVKTSLEVSRILAEGEVDCVVTDPTLPSGLLKTLKVSQYTLTVEVSPLLGAPETVPESYFELMEEVVDRLSLCGKRTAAGKR